MKKWKGILERFGECEAETEQEAMKKMAEQLIKKLQSGEDEFLVWDETDDKSAR